MQKNKENMAVKMNKKIAIHHHPITLPASLGITRKIVGEEEEKRRIVMPVQERGAKFWKAVHAALAQLLASPLRNAVGQ